MYEECQTWDVVTKKWTKSRASKLNSRLTNRCTAMSWPYCRPSLPNWRTPLGRTISTMANQRPIRTKPWRRWRRRGRKIPESRIAKKIIYFPVASPCTPQKLDPLDPVCTGTTGPTHVVDIIPALVPSANDWGEAVKVTSVDINFHLVRDVPVNDICEEVQTGVALEMSAASLHVRWALLRMKDVEVVAGQGFGANVFTRAWNMFNTYGGFPTGAQSIHPLTQDVAPLLAWGEKVVLPKYFAYQLQYFNPTTCAEVFLTPENEENAVDPVQFPWYVGHESMPHVSFHVKRNFRRMPMILTPGDSLMLVMNCKSWFSATNATIILSAYGKVGIESD